jgi:hypothetical protein
MERERTSEGNWVRPVRSLSAVRTAGVFFEFLPRGRLEELPPLAGDMELAGFAACAEGPVAMVVRAGERNSGSATEILMLRSGVWVRVSAPWESVASDVPVWKSIAGGPDGAVEPVGIVQLLNWRGGIAVAMAAPGAKELMVWFGSVRGGVDSAPTLVWKLEMFGLGEEIGRSAAAVRLAFVEAQRAADDAILAVAPGTAKGLRVYSVRRGSLGLLADLPETPSTATMVPMTAPGDIGAPSGLLTFAWPTGNSVPGPTAMMVREVSALTGRTMYAGPSHAATGFRRYPHQAIVIVVVLVGVGVTFLALNRGPRMITGLATGVRATEPLRRLMAAGLDYVPSAVVVAVVQGRSALVLLAPSTMLGGGGLAIGELDLWSMGVALGLTAVHAGVCEWAWGRSFGKFVMGLRVVAVERAVEGPGAAGEARIRLWQAMVRNGIRWMAPLAAVFVMFDEFGRHPGDLAAGTLVVADKNDGS